MRANPARKAGGPHIVPANAPSGTVSQHSRPSGKQPGVHTRKAKACVATRLQPVRPQLPTAAARVCRSKKASVRQSRTVLLAGIAPEKSE